jgi:hypothetical protein
MTPKEKAEEIWLYFDQYPNMSSEDVKASSLFVVNEILKYQEDLNCLDTTPTTSWDFWDKVKLEIENG